MTSLLVDLLSPDPTTFVSTSKYFHSYSNCRHSASLRTLWEQTTADEHKGNKGQWIRMSSFQDYFVIAKVVENALCRYCGKIIIFICI